MFGVLLLLLLSSSSSSSSLMRGIYVYIHETNCPYGIECCSCSVVSIHGAHVVSFSVKSIVLYISTFRSMCAVPNMAVFCSSCTSCLPGMLLTYFLNEFEIVLVAPIITGTTFVFTFHMRCFSIFYSRLLF